MTILIKAAMAGVECWGWKLCEVLARYDGWEAALDRMDRAVVRLMVEVDTHRVWRFEWSGVDPQTGRGVNRGAVYYTRSRRLLNRVKQLGLVDDRKQWLG